MARFYKLLCSFVHSYYYDNVKQMQMAIYFQTIFVCVSYSYNNNNTVVFVIQWLM